MPIDTISHLTGLMREHGAKRVYAKPLSPNDNSKNQVYLGGDFSVLNILPHNEILTDSDSTAGSKRDRAKAKLNFSWIDQSGLYPALHSQLILYPKYPEVRFSGFLLGCRRAPSDVMTIRNEGRVLFLGITNSGEVLGYAASADSLLAKEFNSEGSRLPEIGIFREIPMTGTVDSKTELINSLKRIYEKHWIGSKKLGDDGIAKPYKARNGGGYTLEAELGVSPNGYAEPDYLGWEIKQYSVNNFESYRSKTPVTLFTPEPTGGIYKDSGLLPFMQRFGYADKSGILNRRNFGGVYSCKADFHKDTGLRMTLLGYDYTKGVITDMTSGLALVDRHDKPAAIWNYSSILEHWNRKHAKAAYIPSLFQTPPPEYRYGRKILLYHGTDFSRFLKALISSNIYLDPAIKVIRHEDGRIESKRRNQFRIHHKHLDALYANAEIITL